MSDLAGAVNLGVERIDEDAVVIDIVSLLKTVVDSEADRLRRLSGEEVVKSEVLWGRASEVQVVVAAWNTVMHPLLLHRPFIQLVFKQSLTCSTDNGLIQLIFKKTLTNLPEMFP